MTCIYVVCVCSDVYNAGCLMMCIYVMCVRSDVYNAGC